MARTILATIAGYILWTVLWLAGSLAVQVGWPEEFAAFSSGSPITSTAPLLCSLALSMVCSLIAGRITATISGRVQPASGVLSALLLLTGVGVQASSWALMPVWYHLTFLALLVPLTLLGASLGRST